MQPDSAGGETFFDGKLNTLVKDPNGRNHEDIERFVGGEHCRNAYQQKRTRNGCADRLMMIHASSD